MQQKNITITRQATIAFPCTKQMPTHAFRSIFSAWLEHNSLSYPSVFQRDASGNLLQSYAHFRFETVANLQLLHAIGEQACKELIGLHHALSRLTERPEFIGACVLTEQKITASIAENQKYLCTNLIVCKNATQYKLWQACTETQRRERIAAVALQGIKSQAKELNMNGLDQITVSCDALIHEWSEPKLTTVSANAFVRIVNAVLSINAHLTGTWAAGPLISKGHGCIKAP